MSPVAGLYAGPYRTNAYEERSHAGHGTRYAIHSGSPTEIVWCGCGALLYRGREVKTMSMKNFIRQHAREGVSNAAKVG